MSTANLPLLLGDLDAHVQEYIRKLRLAGCRAIVIAAATGVVIII